MTARLDQPPGPPIAIEWFMAQIQALRVLPIVTLDHPSSAVEIAHALTSAGLSCAEFSLRTEGALESIAAVVRAVPDMLVGAGTAMRAGQVDEVLGVGAHFVASPVTDRDVVERARQLRVPIIPGVERHTDAIAAQRESIRVVRLAISRAPDGREVVRRYAKLFPYLRFIPAGPIDPADVAGYLREPNVLAVASTRLVPYGAGAAEVRRRAAQAVLSAGDLLD